jgi:hypothetical protein
MKNRQKESRLTSRILKYLNSRDNCKAIKNHGSIFSEKGRPDIDLSDNGRHGVIEVKIWPEKPSIIQRKRLKQWRLAGSRIMVAYSLERVKQRYP